MNASLNYMKYAAVELSTLPWYEPNDKRGEIDRIVLPVDISRLPANVKIKTITPGPCFAGQRMFVNPTPSDPTRSRGASCNPSAGEGFSFACLDSSYILHDEAKATSEAWAWTSHVPPTKVDKDDPLWLRWQDSPWYGSGSISGMGMRLKGIELKSRESTQPAWTPGSSKPERGLIGSEDADEEKTPADIRYDRKLIDEKEKAEERKEDHAAPNYRNYLNRLIPALRKYTGDTRNFQILPDRDRELWGAELLQYCIYLVSSKRKGDNIFWETSTTDDTVSEFALRMLERIFTPRKDDPRYPDEVPYVECGKLRGFMTGVWETFKKNQKCLLLTDEDPLNHAASLQSDTGDADPDLQNRNGTLAEDAVSYGTEVQHGITYVDSKTGKRTPSKLPSDMFAESQKIAEKRKATFTEFENAGFEKVIAGEATKAERKALVRSVKNKLKAKKKRGAIDSKTAADSCPLPGTIADVCAPSEVAA